MSKVDVIHGDCREAIKVLADSSIDACCTDPPYSLVSIQKRFGKPGQAPAQFGKDGLYQRASSGFMGQQWDTGETAHDPVFWAEVLRVLKPGAHLVAFGGTRTYHRLACAIEDAGFEIRDQIGWCFGSGFPKSHNIGEGRGTALKPAWEPICLARKPLIGTVAANVQEFGTGALNIDGCRIETSDSLGGGAENPDTDAVYKVEGWDRPWMHDEKARAKHSARVRANVQKAETLGRWPANLCHDGSEEVIAAFPDGLTSGTGAVKRATGSGYQGNAYGKESRAPGTPNVEYGDTGSAARFFYAAKADADDRCDSKHPTVKPVSLMRWLARLVTPPGGLLLDPFAGSGTTGVACIREGFDCILIEREEKYVADIRRRLAKLQGLDTPLFKELRE